MKYFAVLFFLFLNTICAQEYIKGKVLDASTGAPLTDANILIENTNTGVATDDEGEFVLQSENALGRTIIVRYLGYKSEIIKVNSKDDITVRLEPVPIPSQSVLVEASIGREGITPAAFTKVTKQDIKDNYSVQDIPAFLGSLPSAMFYSEGGNGIGYNYISLRGFDQRRITVSINGIPQNDPEDHNVYWLDFPDLLESTQLIQVQRGAGGIFGYPSIGGSINIITSGFTPHTEIKLSGAYGSYHTRKYGASFSSGLINGKYSLYGSLSQILSSGYRDLSWVKYNSYHFSAVRYDRNFTTQFNFFGGPVADGLAYTGLPKFAVDDPELRRANYSYWEADENAYTFVVPRRPEEKENFSQPHFELLNDYRISDNVSLNSALFLVIGSGFFDYDASWADTSYFRVTSEYGFNPAGNPGNAIIRAMVENTQYGWIPRISIKHPNGELLAGSEIRIHRSVHWGGINFAENLPSGLPADYKYYSYNGSKDIINGFINERYQFTDKIGLQGELQIAYHKYGLDEEKFLNNEFTVDGLFFNPKAGINYRINDRQNVFLSFARVTREPRLKNYYDAAESSAGEIPMFEQDAEGFFDFTSPLVEPETMNDFEIGTVYTSGNINFSLNLYYMLFNNEIVKNGKIDRFGQPVTGNMPKTLHRGLEASVIYKAGSMFEFFTNASYSRNTIEEGRYFIDGNSYIDLSGNRISGFPDFLASAGALFRYQGIFLQLTGRYTGAFYSDNYDENLQNYIVLYPGFTGYTDNKNDAYFTADLSASYEMNLFNEYTPSKIYLQVFNLTNSIYSAYAIGKEFFPAAERYFMTGVQIGL